ncbi:MAG: hypothetical protein U0174_28095 [Polyangiaceae bacterium]
MLRTSITPSALLAITTLSTTGCFFMGTYSSNAAKMPNPLVSGNVAPNKAEERRDAAIMYSGLQTPWVNEASIASLDDKEICFDLKLRWITEKSETIGDDSFVDVNKLLPQVENQPKVQWRVKSATPVVHSPAFNKGYERTREPVKFCDANGNHCQYSTMERSVPVTREYRILDGSGTLCGAHGGKIAKNTEALSLILSPPAYPGKETHRFDWKFVAKQ